LAKAQVILRIGIDKTHELFQDRVISSIVKKAEGSSDFAESLKKQFSKIVDDEKRLGVFRPTNKLLFVILQKVKLQVLGFQNLLR